MKKPRPTEHEEQVKLFQWAKLSEKKYPELALMFAIPNGGDRHAIVGKKLRDEGVKRGIPDIFLPVFRAFLSHPPLMPDIFCGLFIEMKRDFKEKPRPEQEKWMDNLEKQGYKCVIGYGFEDARDKILKYLGEER